MSHAPSPRRAVGRPKDERADPAIVPARVQLIPDGGVRDLRSDDVAARAGVGSATIYRRHRSKNALISAAVSTLVTEIAIPDSGSTRRDLLALKGQGVELYSWSLAPRLMPSLVEEARRDPQLANTIRNDFL